MMTRAEHLKWCKDRANEYLAQGDVPNAVTSMLSDMGKHPETKVNAAIEMLGMMAVMNHNRDDAKRFIDGFN